MGWVYETNGLENIVVIFCPRRRQHGGVMKPQQMMKHELNIMRMDNERSASRGFL